MKKITLIILNSQFLILNCFSQSNWFPQNSGVTSNLNDIIFYSSVPSGYAVGNSGVIIITTDTGVNWFQRISNTTSNLRSVALAPNYAFACGDNGTLVRGYLTNDWAVVNSNTTATLNCVHFTQGIGVAVGNSGTIIKSTNGGLNWNVRSSGTNANLNGIASGYYIFVVGNNGTCLRSYDFGETWTLLNTGTIQNLNSVAGGWYTSWAVGNNGTIIRTTNEGSNWTTINSGTTNNLKSITMAFPYLFVSGDNGTIIKIVTLGNYYTIGSENSGTTQNLNSIHFSGRNGWCTGSNGLILKDSSEFWRFSSKLLDANTISTWFRNDGLFNRHAVTLNAGFEWPKSTNKFARFSSGLWIGAIVGTDTLVTVGNWSTEYFPGFTNNNGIPWGKNDTNYRVYKLSHGINDNDRQRWPNAILGNSDQGAPVYFDTLSNSWRPLDYADQTIYYCYTDSYYESHQMQEGRTLPLKADIKQVNWSFDEPGAIGNIAYTQYTIINRSSNVWNNAFFMLWSDDDVGDATDDRIGCDTLTNLVYTYNGDNYDDVYGTAPPAVGTLVLKGPHFYTGNSNDTSFYCSGRRKFVKVGYRDTGLYSFNLWLNDGPRIYRESYWTMLGFDVNYNPPPRPWINPVTNMPTRYVYSGDPVSNTGWIDPYNNDERLWPTIGPVNVNPGDTQIIVIAQIIGRGTSNINSITVLRQYAQVAKEIYNNCFANVPIAIQNNNEAVYQFRLEQNYPNPFNAITKLKFQIPKTSNVKLIIYDVLGREIETLVNEKLNPGTYESEWDATDYPSGVYFYKLLAGDYSETRKMVLIR